MKKIPPFCCRPFYIFLFTLLTLQQVSIFTQNICVKPFALYPKVFHDVAVSKIFLDGKTWVDAIPLLPPIEIDKRYVEQKTHKDFNLKKFVAAHFMIPDNAPQNQATVTSKNIQKHLSTLWQTLYLPARQQQNNTTLLALPLSYIVPGGRFREVYYWDSYFTMLGLKTAKEYDKIDNMVANFATQILQYGFVPNGNRSYYLSRSQPPFFSLMVQLLASIKGDQVYVKYLPALEREYAYWMDRILPTRHVVVVGDNLFLNRYFDRDTVPREESYAADFELAQKTKTNPSFLYRNLRTGAESGWDFSSRWFADQKNLSTIETVNILPVDLNCLLWNLEQVIAQTHGLKKDVQKQNQFQAFANTRKQLIQKVFYNRKSGWYEDFNIRTGQLIGVKTLAGLMPLFFKLLSENQTPFIIANVKYEFLKSGGLVCSLNETGQQWDAPNSWAPLQWISIIGLENYGYHQLAQDIATRWTKVNFDVFQRTGKMMEKYNVVNTNLEAGGGEYSGQDGFGWTNGVFLALVEKYKLVF